MIEDLLKIKLTNLHLSDYSIKAPGLLESHYSPNAQIILNGEPMPGDGFIALIEEKTPIGTIRLSAPVDTDQYAQDLYNSFRLGDTLKLSRIIAILPEGSGISEAIRDRLQKAAASKA
jgi:L-threonylcarbamoyladenylate synthase